MDRFRKNHTPVTTEQKSLVLAIKEKAEELLALYPMATGIDAHCYPKATARLEESVMWAVRAATAASITGSGSVEGVVPGQPGAAA